MLKYYGQVGQDLFVLDIHQYKRNGTFVEIGAFHSQNISNTYLLESKYEWTGVSFEIDPSRVIEFNSNRKNPCVLADATTLNYSETLSYFNLPKNIDYLQIDIEPAYQSLKALELIMSTGYTFGAITFEHDLYADKSNQKIKNKQKEILFNLGYVLYKENVSWDKNTNQPFEDWWISKSLK